MRKIRFFSFTAFIILLLIFFFFSKAYQQRNRYAELINRTNTVYSAFQNLSAQIRTAAVLHSTLTNARNFSGIEQLFITDSQSVFQQLSLLRSTIEYSVNRRIAEDLNG